MIDALRDHLRLNAAFNGSPALLCITGKTTALATIGARIEARLLPRVAFDSLGVPPDDEMVTLTQLADALDHGARRRQRSVREVVVQAVGVDRPRVQRVAALAAGGGLNFRCC